MLPASTSGDPATRTAAANMTVRNVFVIGPDKKVKLILVYPMTTKHKVATPAQWQQGGDVIIAGSMSNDDAMKTYPQGWKSPKPHIRIVLQPK